MTELSRAQVAELSAAIIARGITVDGLAEASGLSADTIYLVMQGRLIPAPYIRDKLAGALGIDPRLLT